MTWRMPTTMRRKSSAAAAASGDYGSRAKHGAQGRRQSVGHRAWRAEITRGRACVIHADMMNRAFAPSYPMTGFRVLGSRNCITSQGDERQVRAWACEPLGEGMAYQCK